VERSLNAEDGWTEQNDPLQRVESSGAGSGMWGLNGDGPLQSANSSAKEGPLLMEGTRRESGGRSPKSVRVGERRGDSRVALAFGPLTIKPGHPRLHPRLCGCQGIAAAALAAGAHGVRQVNPRAGCFRDVQGTSPPVRDFHGGLALLVEVDLLLVDKPGACAELL
jgi:hypothetical protein